MVEERVKELLFRGEELSNSDIAALINRLSAMTLKNLKSLAKSLGIRLTGSSRKGDIIERLIGMARIGAIKKRAEREEEGDEITITYLTEEVKGVLRALPPFSNVVDWSKSLGGILKDFTFMNLLVYLVYGRDKTFDIQSMKAFKSLKAYKFFYVGVVRNVWVYQCPCTNDLRLRVLYFRAYVYHSLSCDSPLEVFVALNGDLGDVYAAQCSCISG